MYVCCYTKFTANVQSSVLHSTDVFSTWAKNKTKKQQKERKAGDLPLPVVPRYKIHLRSSPGWISSFLPQQNLVFVSLWSKHQEWRRSGFAPLASHDNPTGSLWVDSNNIKSSTCINSPWCWFIQRGSVPESQNTPAKSKCVAEVWTLKRRSQHTCTQAVHITFAQTQVCP